jgi:cytochrome c6
VRSGFWRTALGCVIWMAAIPAFGQDSGADIYKLKCAMCHGAQGNADTPAGKAFKAASFSDPAVVKISDADRTAVVKNGKNKMPAFGDKLSADQIKAVLAYIRTLQK